MRCSRLGHAVEDSGMKGKEGKRSKGKVQSVRCAHPGGYAVLVLIHKLLAGMSFSRILLYPSIMPYTVR
jgi:hypothetical protein